MRTFLMLAIVLITAFSSTKAAIPQRINYQGVLTDSTGAGLDTTVDITFGIYENAVGLTPIWVEAHAGVIVTGGLFSVLLGSITPLDVSIFGSTIRYLGITVGADPEISPRIQLVSVPYSFRSQEADFAFSATNALHADTADFADTAALAVLALVAELAIFADSARVADELDSLSSEDFARTSHSHGGSTTGWNDSGTEVTLETIGDSVGIGVSNPAAKLHLEGDLLFGVGSFAKSSPPNKNIIMDNGTNDSPGIKFYYNNNENFGIDGHTQSGGGMRFVENLGETGGEVRMFLRKGGNVGIGTAYPSGLLQITGGKLLMGDSVYSKNPLHPGDIIFENGAIDLPGLKFYYGDNKNFGIDLFDDAGGYLRFVEGLDEGGQTRMAIREGGNVGIGTTTPTEKLDVVGNIKITGDLTVSGNIIGSTPWTSLPLASGYNNYVDSHGGDFQNCEYRKIGDIVYLRGLIHKTDHATIAAGAIMAILPAGFNPQNSLGFAQAQTRRVDILQSGEIIAQFASTSNEFVFLDGIFFSTSP